MYKNRGPNPGAPIHLVQKVGFRALLCLSGQKVVRSWRSSVSSSVSP